MSFIVNSDFIGKFAISTNGYKTGSLELYIERYETKYLVELFGLELYNLWFADVELVTPNAIYLKLKDAFIDQLSCGTILDSKGIADMLLGFVYYHYQMDAKVTQSINSGVKIKSELSEKPLNDYGYIYERWNESIETYKAIQRYICENMDIYPTFKGVEKSYKMLAW